MKWSRKPEKLKGWMAVGVQPGSIAIVHAQDSGGGEPRVDRWTVRPTQDVAADLSRLSKDMSLSRYQCTTLLDPGEYQMLVVDAPNVPKAELKGAMRWRLKDMLDYHVDDAMIDVLDIPQDPAGGSRAHLMYAVAAPSDAIQRRVRLFEDARIPLSVIDVPELAQRNVASLYEAGEGRGVALLHVGPQSGLLTISFRGELYLARRIETTFAQLEEADSSRRQELFNRVLLEVQRTFDHFERQFRLIAVSRLLLGPEPKDCGLAAYLADNLGIAVERVRLQERIRFPADSVPQAEDEWRLFHQVGASLRNEAAVL